MNAEQEIREGAEAIALAVHGSNSKLCTSLAAAIVSFGEMNYQRGRMDAAKLIQTEMHRMAAEVKQ